MPKIKIFKFTKYLRNFTKESEFSVEKNRKIYFPNLNKKKVFSIKYWLSSIFG